MNYEKQYTQGSLLYAIHADTIPVSLWNGNGSSLNGNGSDVSSDLATYALSTDLPVTEPLNGSVGRTTGSLLDESNQAQFYYVSGASRIIDGRKLAEEHPRNIGRAETTIARGIAMIVASQQGIIYEAPDQRARKIDRIANIYSAVSSAVKRENINVSPKFAHAVYWEIMPTLLGINEVTNTVLNEQGYNSMDQLASTVVTLMKAESVRDAGGTFRIFSPMCAQMDTGVSHDQDACARGLLTTINRSKLQQAVEPMQVIANVLQSFDVPVEIITPQVTADPQLLLALVPSTVWSYVEKGEVAEMLTALDDMSRLFPTIVRPMIGISDDDPYHRYYAPSYTEVGIYGESIISRTLRYSTRFGQLYDAYHNHVNEELPTSATVSWVGLSTHEARNFTDSILDDNLRPVSLFDDVANKHNWTTDEKTIVLLMLRNLIRTDNEGVLKHLEVYYDREIQRRTDMTAEEWMRTFDRGKEMNALLMDEQFYSNLDQEQRIQMASDLLDWTHVIANIGMGGRGIFNVALYASIAEFVVNSNRGKDAGILLPLEEDYERFSSSVMMQVWKVLRDEKTNDMIPLLYARKDLRQPFN